MPCQSTRLAGLVSNRRRRSQAARGYCTAFHRGRQSAHENDPDSSSLLAAAERLRPKNRRGYACKEDDRSLRH